MAEQGWSITVEAAGTKAGAVDDDALDNFATLLAKLDIAVSCAQDHSGYGATFSVSNAEAGHDPSDAALYGLRAFRDAAVAASLPELPIVELQVLTDDEQDRRLAVPAIPELVGVTEIAEDLGVSRQRAHQLTKRPDFPAPIAKLQAGPVWTRPSLDRFVEQWREAKPDRSADMQVLSELTRLNDAIHTTTSTVSVSTRDSMLEQLTKMTGFLQLVMNGASPIIDELPPEEAAEIRAAAQEAAEKDRRVGKL